MTQHPELTLHQLGDALRRYKISAALVFVTVLAAGVGLWLVLPREYGSEGRLFVQIGRANTGLDPTSSPKSFSIQDTRETEIRSVMELIRSPGLLQRVVEQVGIEEVLAHPWDPYFPKLDFSAWFPGKVGGGDGEESPQELERLKRRELAVKKVSHNLQVTLEKNSGVITIYLTANNSRLAEQLVAAIMAETSRQHLEVHSVHSSGEVFQAELERHQQLVWDSLQKQTEFRNSRGLLSQEAGRNTLQLQIDKLELDLLAVDIDLAQATRRADEMRMRLETLDEFVDAPNRGLESQSTEGARAELFRLESEKARLSALYFESHPLLKQVVEQIESLQSEIAKLPTQRTEMLAVVNPVYAEVKVALIDQESIVAGLQTRRSDLMVKREAVTARLQALNQDDAIADQLAQEVEIRRSHLDVYVQKSGEAQVLSELDRQSISDVVVAQPAVRLYKAVSPRGSVILPICAALALVMAILVAWWRDAKHWRQRRHQNEIEQSLNIPVLATLPRVAARRQIVR